MERRTAQLAIILAIAAIWMPARTRAQETTERQLAQLHDLLLRAHYEEAIVAAQAILGRRDLDATERNAALEGLATAHVAHRAVDAAAEVLRVLYTRDPGHRHSDPDVSPLVQAAFGRARSAARPVTVEIRHAPQGRLDVREAPLIELSLGEGADAVDEIRLAYREVGASRFAQVVMTTGDDGLSRARIPLLTTTSESYAVHYYIEALAPSRTVLARRGSEARPLQLIVPAARPPPAPAPVAAAPVLTAPEPASDSGGGIEGEWWLWALVGLVVVGGGVAVGVLVWLDQQGPTGSLGTFPFGR